MKKDAVKIRSIAPKVAVSIDRSFRLGALVRLIRLSAHCGGAQSGGVAEGVKPFVANPYNALPRFSKVE